MYKGDTPENFNFVIKDGTIKICSNLFKYSWGSDTLYGTNIISLIIPSTIISIGSNCFGACVNLHEIICYVTDMPYWNTGMFNPFYYDYYDMDEIHHEFYTGQNTKPNVLKVPTGATGYDTGAWYDILQNSSKCGFVIEYI